jgi:hypothetical protein
MPTRLSALALAALACQCDGDTQDSTVEWTPDVYCPGDPTGTCDDNDGVLKAGVGAVTITPTCWETWEDVDGNGEYKTTTDEYFDCGCDRLCEGDEGYPGPDEGEGDDDFQAVWMAGFGNGRAAQTVHDDLWARAVVLEQGSTRVALVSVDLVGWFYDDVVETRAQLAEAGVEVDYVLVSATHDHEAPDTVGMWGRRLGATGYQEDYAQLVRSATVEAITDAVTSLEEVTTLTVGAVDSSVYHAQGTYNVVDDSRDPVVLDEEVKAAHFAGASGTITTLINWGNHPEVLGGDNLHITSDFAHYLREGVEDGVTWSTRQTPGLGGTAIYVQGMVGGLMTPLHTTVMDPDGNSWRENTFEKAEATGKLVAEMAMDAVATGDVIAGPKLSIASTVVTFPIENIGFQAMFLTGVLDRNAHGYDPDRPLGLDNIPYTNTEIALIRVGDWTLLSVPGELFPEVAIGGYDGSHINAPGIDLVSPTNENPPALDEAPVGPYLMDDMATKHAWIIGLGNDELGYMIPPYDFELDDLSPYIGQAPGDHYEETNSLGPETVPIVEEAAARLLTWQN